MEHCNDDDYDHENNVDDVDIDDVTIHGENSNSNNNNNKSYMSCSNDDTNNDNVIVAEKEAVHAEESTNNNTDTMNDVIRTWKLPTEWYDDNDEDNDDDDDKDDNNQNNHNDNNNYASVDESNDNKTNDNEDSKGEREQIRESSSLFDMLSLDLQCSIFQYLLLDEIVCSCSLVNKTFHRACRSNRLWKYLFAYRWNIHHENNINIFIRQQRNQNSNTSTDFIDNEWYVSYQRAHFHPHDLWITHWNCVYPDDTLSPGRCYIPTNTTTTSTGASTKKKHMDNAGNTKNHTYTNTANDNMHSFCPNCRYTSIKNDDYDCIFRTNRKTPATAAQRMAMATQLYRQKRQQLFSSRTNNEPKTNPIKKQPKKSKYTNSTRNQRRRRKCRHSFACAGTYHRILQTKQYEDYDATTNHDPIPPPRTNFLTDLLFFNITDPMTSIGQREIQQVLQEEHDKIQWSDNIENNNNTNATRRRTTTNNNIRHQRGHANNNNLNIINDDVNDDTNDAPLGSSSSVLSTLYESTNHSWHIIQLYNPDYVRPITYQFAIIQKYTNFVIYPSQGIVLPGECTYVTIGVRPSGGANSYSYNSLNIFRDSLSMAWAKFYTEYAHIPMSPIIVRYHFGPSSSMSDPITASTATNDNDNVQNDIDGVIQQHNNSSNNRRSTSKPTGQPATTGSTVVSMKVLKQKFLSYHRKYHTVPAHQIRTIHLSAHVHSYYTFDDFLRTTMQPWNLSSLPYYHYNSYTHGPIYYSPILREEYFVPIYNNLQNIPLPNNYNSRNNIANNEDENSMNEHNWNSNSSISNDGQLSRILSCTERPCRVCKNSWGLRDEELLHAYEVAMGEVVWNRGLRATILRNVIQCLHFLQQESATSDTSKGLFEINEFDSYKLATLLYCIYAVIQSSKASPYTSVRQKYIILQLEGFVDKIYYKMIPNEESSNDEKSRENDVENTWIPWRRSGVFRYILCTDSIYRQDQCFSQLSSNACQMELGDDDRNHDIDAIFHLNAIDWKDEPYYLDAFRHLAHSPGRFCLGPQVDPNHLNDNVHLPPSKYLRNSRQRGCTSDLFMDDPISTFQAGICMIRDPRSLLVHGLFDQLSYPGAVVRRPKINYHLEILNNMKADNTTHDAPPKLLTSENQWAYYRLQNGFDMQSIADVDCVSVDQSCSNYTKSLSLNNYISGIPAVGVGRFPLSHYLDSKSKKDIAPLLFERSSERIPIRTDFHYPTPGDSLEDANNGPAPLPRDPAIPPGGQGPRFLRLLWLLGARLGLAVVDMPDTSSVFVERSILIASQWVSISFMLVPMFWTLFARYSLWIPTLPVEYHLDSIPFIVTNKMRYLSEEECGWVASFLVFAWLALGRWTERHTGRDFSRVMLEHVSPLKYREKGKISVRRKLYEWFSMRLQRQWDAICPLFLQRRIFTPHWNLRTKNGLTKHIAFWRSRNIPEQRAAARNNIRIENGVFGDCRDIGMDISSTSSTRKLIIGFFALIGSFSLCSPHFWLNVVTVFSCSISLGMNVSLHSMEKGRSFNETDSTGSMIKKLSVVTIVILACLVGQLVGSSGGTLFLAEFIVTSISLLLGGAGTISASAMESWICFFCLSSTAFWGYLFGRVALIDGIRKKRGGYASVLLSRAVLFLFLFWLFIFMVSTWEFPVGLIIVKPAFENKNKNRDHMARKLQ